MKYVPHSMRLTSAPHLLKLGVDGSTVMRICSWVSARLLFIYDNRCVELADEVSAAERGTAKMRAGSGLVIPPTGGVRAGAGVQGPGVTVDRSALLWAPRAAGAAWVTTLASPAAFARAAFNYAAAAGKGGRRPPRPSARRACGCMRLQQARAGGFVCPPRLTRSCWTVSDLRRHHERRTLSPWEGRWVTTRGAALGRPPGLRAGTRGLRRCPKQRAKRALEPSAKAPS